MSGDKINLSQSEVRALASLFLPYIEEYYNSAEGAVAFEEWKQGQDEPKGE